MFSSNSGYNSVPANIEGVELSQTNPIHNNNGTPEDDDIDLEKASSNNNKTITEECFNEIRILDLKGDTYKLKNIPLNATIGDLKIEIENETEIPILLQRLIYSGKQLSDDNQTLVDAKVKDKTVIHLFKRPCPQASTVEPVIATEIGTTATAISTQQNNTIAELVNQNMATEFVPEFETYRRRVKMLACMLFLISLLNLVRHTTLHTNSFSFYPLLFWFFSFSVPSVSFNISLVLLLYESFLACVSFSSIFLFLSI